MEMTRFSSESSWFESNNQEGNSVVELSACW